MNLSRADIEQSLFTLRAQIRADNRWHSILDERAIDSGTAAMLCEGLAW